MVLLRSIEQLDRSLAGSRVEPDWHRSLRQVAESTRLIDRFGRYRDDKDWGGNSDDEEPEEGPEARADGGKPPQDPHACAHAVPQASLLKTVRTNANFDEAPDGHPGDDEAWPQTEIHSPFAAGKATTTSSPPNATTTVTATATAKHTARTPGPPPVEQEKAVGHSGCDSGKGAAAAAVRGKGNAASKDALERGLGLAAMFVGVLEKEEAKAKAAATGADKKVKGRRVVEFPPAVSYAHVKSRIDTQPSEKANAKQAQPQAQGEQPQAQPAKPHSKAPPTAAKPPEAASAHAKRGRKGAVPPGAAAKTSKAPKGPPATTASDGASTAAAQASNIKKTNPQPRTQGQRQGKSHQGGNPRRQGGASTASSSSASVGKLSTTTRTKKVGAGPSQASSKSQKSEDAKSETSSLTSSVGPPSSRPHSSPVKGQPSQLPGCPGTRGKVRPASQGKSPASLTELGRRSGRKGSRQRSQSSSNGSKSPAGREKPRRPRAQDTGKQRGKNNVKQIRKSQLKAIGETRPEDGRISSAPRRRRPRPRDASNGKPGEGVKFVREWCDKSDPPTFWSLCRPRSKPEVAPHYLQHRPRAINFQPKFVVAADERSAESIVRRLVEQKMAGEEVTVLSEGPGTGGRGHPLLLFKKKSKKCAEEDFLQYSTMNEFAADKQGKADKNLSKRTLRKAGRLKQPVPLVERDFTEHTVVPKVTVQNLFAASDGGQDGPQTTKAAAVSPTTLRRRGVKLRPAAWCGAAAGTKHVLGVTDDGEVYSWGLTSVGRLGFRSGVEVVDTPTQVPFTLFSEQAAHLFNFHESLDPREPPKVVQVAAGDDFSAAVTNKGELYTWGCGDDGKLGHNDIHPSFSPRIVTALLRRRLLVRQVACGRDHTLVRTHQGTVFATGSVEHGVLGCGRHIAHGAPTAGPLPTKRTYVAEFTHVHTLTSVNVIDVAAGANHSMAVGDNGLLYTCGKTSAGVLGHGEGQLFGVGCLLWCPHHFYATMALCMPHLTCRPCRAGCRVCVLRELPGRRVGVQGGPQPPRCDPRRRRVLAQRSSYVSGRSLHVGLRARRETWARRRCLGGAMWQSAVCMPQYPGRSIRYAQRPRLLRSAFLLRSPFERRVCVHSSTAPTPPKFYEMLTIGWQTQWYPRRVEALTERSVIQVSCGRTHTCIRVFDCSHRPGGGFLLYMCGDDELGQLGLHPVADATPMHRRQRTCCTTPTLVAHFSGEGAIMANTGSCSFISAVVTANYVREPAMRDYLCSLGISHFNARRYEAKLLEYGFRDAKSLRTTTEEGIKNMLGWVKGDSKPGLDFSTITVNADIALLLQSLRTWQFPVGERRSLLTAGRGGFVANEGPSDEAELESQTTESTSLYRVGSLASGDDDLTRMGDGIGNRAESGMQLPAVSGSGRR